MKFAEVLVEAKKEKLELSKLKYAQNGLQPVMAKETIEIHYGTLTKNYFKNYNKDGDDWNHAGAFLHAIWWDQFKPVMGGNSPTGEIKKFIEEKFKDFKKFQDEFEEQGSTIHGSGWVYLAKSGDIKIIPNHAIKKDIVLLFDMWEHAYIEDPQYKADKKKYLKDLWKILDWDVISSRL
jgi:superoxide dismutase, Fe-Mn family